MPFKRASMLKLYPNIGLLDAAFGRYMLGEKGEALLAGGLTHFEGICGLPNMYKTALTLYKKAAILIRYSSSQLNIYDTETTFRPTRVSDTLRYMRGGDTVDLEERFVFSDANGYYGDEWFEDYKKLCKSRYEDKSKHLTSEFYNHRTGKHITSPGIYMVFLDSLSEFNAKAVSETRDKEEIDSKGLNMIDMRGGRIKSHLISHIIGMNVNAGTYVTMTAQVGEKYSVDPYAPDINKLKLLGSALKLKKVPENFMFLTHGNWFNYASRPLLNKSDRMPEYPRGSNDKVKDVDLQTVIVLETRGKFGPSGEPFELVVSQSEGLKVDLTHFNFLKARARYGIGGSLQNFYLELYPDRKMTRNTIRGLTESDAKLSRAMDFTTDMAILRHDTPRIDSEMIPDPKDLYARITELGYDWDTLYNTRSWWTFKEDKHPLNFLSTMDLIRMYHGFYHPYWYPKTAKQMGITITKSDFGIG